MIKITSLFVLLLSISIFNIKATEPCATEYPIEMENWLREHVKNNPNPSFKRSSEPYYIPVKVHIVGTDQGGGYYRTSNLMQAFCTLNQQFAETGFYFYIYQDVNYINNSALYEHAGFWGGHSLTIQSNRVSGVANMFFVNDPAGACGYYSWGGGNDFIAIKNSCGGPNNSTIAHEFGHYFSLPHTFNGWEGGNPPSNPERMDGSNCSTSADFFCDTPPDYLSYRWNCPYNDNILDPVGVPIQPDGKNIMSYSNDACTEYFSNEQMNAMNAYLMNQKSFLLDHPQPEVVSFDSTTLIYPVGGVTNVTPNYAQFKWNAVDGATHYHVFITRYINPNLANVDTIVTDTTILITDLTPNLGTYRWKVRPFSNMYTCAPETQLNFFTTGSESVIQPTVNVNKPSCSNNTDGSILLSIDGGTPPYTYSWSHGATGPTASGVGVGTYEITVTDNAGNELDFFVNLPGPDPIKIQFITSGNQLSLDVTGGQPPYTFLWNTGSTSSSVSFDTGNQYMVEVMDNKGCTGFNSITISNVEELNALTKSLKVFPNPITRTGSLYIQFETETDEDVVFRLFDNTGRQIRSWNEFAHPGIQTFNLGLERNTLTPGIYLLHIIKGDIAATRKIQIL